MANGNFRTQLGSSFREAAPRPDRAAFDRRLNATLRGFRQQVGFGAEQVRSRSASAGLFRAGQTEEAIIREVLAPAEAGVAQAVSQAEIQFGQLEQQAFATGSGLDLQQFGIESNRELEFLLEQERQRASGFGFGQIAGAVGGAVFGPAIERLGTEFEGLIFGGP